MAVTVGELKGYWKKVADAVSSNKMNVTDTDILAALMAIGQTIEDVEAEIQAIKNTDGIKKIADTVDVQLTGSIAAEGMGVHTVQNTSNLAANTEQVVFSRPAGKSIEIYELQFASDHRTDTAIRISARGADGTLRILRTITRNGSGSFDRHNVDIVNSQGSAFFEVLSDSESGYKIGLKRPIVFPNGLEIERINKSTEQSYRAGFYIVYREVN